MFKEQRDRAYQTIYLLKELTLKLEYDMARRERKDGYFVDWDSLKYDIRVIYDQLKATYGEE